MSVRNLMMGTKKEEASEYTLELWGYGLGGTGFDVYWGGYFISNSYPFGSISPTTFCDITISGCYYYSEKSSSPIVYFELSGEKVSDKIILIICGSEYTLDWESSHSRYVLNDETQCAEVAQYFAANMFGTVDIGIKKG